MSHVDYLDIAYKQLSFAIKLSHYPILLPDFDNIGLSICNQYDPSGCILFPDNQFPTEEDLQRAMENNILMCIGALAITLWETIKVKYDYITDGKKCKRLDTEEEKLAGLIYQIRCCYAHGMAEPRWDIRLEKYKIVYILGKKSIDLSNAHGTIFTQDLIGGDIALWLLRDECKAKNMF